MHQKLLLYLIVQNISILENKSGMIITLFIETSKVILLSVAILQVHTAGLKNKLCALRASFTDSSINAPQRKKEIERYGEREKLYICWYSKLLNE